MGKLVTLLAAIGLASTSVANAQVQTGPGCDRAVNLCTSGGYRELGYSNPSACYEAETEGMYCPGPTEDPYKDRDWSIYYGPICKDSAPYCYSTPE
jgi:hypothetical protein